MNAAFYHRLKAVRSAADPDLPERVSPKEPRKRKKTSKPRKKG